MTASKYTLYDPALMSLASALDDMELIRIANRNRIRILTLPLGVLDKNGKSRGHGLTKEHPTVALLTSVTDTMEEKEKDTIKMLEKRMKAHPLGPWMTTTTGLGAKTFARLIGAIGDPYIDAGAPATDGRPARAARPRTLEELNAYCGMHVVNGAAPRRTRGQKANWKSRARKALWSVSERTIWCTETERRQASPYRLIYDEAKLKYADAVHPVPCPQCGTKGKPAAVGTPLKDGHKHARAQRIVAKAILRDLWMASAKLHHEHGDPYGLTA